MSLTARHKKPGGFRKLVNSLETTVEEKRAKILEAMRKEDPDFTGEIEACVFNFSEFGAINDLIICEIVGAFSKEMRTIALALYHCEDEALMTKFKKNFQPKEAYEFKEQSETLQKVMARERIAAQFRIIEKARELESQRKFTLKRYSPHYQDDA